MIPYRYHNRRMNRKALGARVKALREQKGWAQQRLAQALNVSRNTVNRWEMGERTPSLTMIERIAAALGVAVDAVLPDLGADRGQGALPVPARVIRVDPAALGRAPGLKEVLSLAAMVDEGRTLRRLLIISQERLHTAPTAAEQAVLVGESGYFFRALCAVLAEAGDVFSQLERHAPTLVDEATSGHSDGEAAARSVRQRYAAEAAAGDKAFLTTVRNWVKSHYDPQQLERQFRKGVNARDLAGELVLTPHAGVGRYVLIDELATRVIRKALRVPYSDFARAFHAKLGEVVTLAYELSIVIEHVISHVAEGNVQLEEMSAMRVDPLIARARRQLAAARKKAGVPEKVRP